MNLIVLAQDDEKVLKQLTIRVLKPPGVYWDAVDADIPQKVLVFLNQLVSVQFKTAFRHQVLIAQGKPVHKNDAPLVF